MNHGKIEQLRNILIDSGAPEYGDVVIDKICHLFNHPDTNQFTQPTADEIESEGAARELATNWQSWQAEQSLSIGEYSDWQGFFEELAKKFDLTEEFRENAII